jgi:hypothetical protein
MGVVFLFIKIFPVFGIALTILFSDLTRNFRRKGNRAWVGTLMIGFIFFALSVVWIVFRGDRNADLWFRNMSDWLQH